MGTESLKQTYLGMISRCYYPSYAEYYLYGGCGIKVCDRWRFGDGHGLSGFDCFAADMAPKINPHFVLDRIENTKEYSPQNCRWASRAAAYRNRRTATEVLRMMPERYLEQFKASRARRYCALVKKAEDEEREAAAKGRPKNKSA
jgi:hypothetical protein